MSNTFKVERSINNRTGMPIITLYNARLIFTNFRGLPGMYNQEGDRNFKVIIDDPDEAQKLINEGWRVSIYHPRNEDEEPFYTLKVKVSYRFSAPTARLITRKHPEGVPLDENDIGQLDTLDLSCIDLEIQASKKWLDRSTGQEYYGAYLRSIYATVQESSLANKYAQSSLANKHTRSAGETEDWKADLTRAIIDADEENEKIALINKYAQLAGDTEDWKWDLARAIIDAYEADEELHPGQSTEETDLPF